MDYVHVPSQLFLTISQLLDDALELEGPRREGRGSPAAPAAQAARALPLRHRVELLAGELQLPQAESVIRHSVRARARAWAPKAFLQARFFSRRSSNFARLKIQQGNAFSARIVKDIFLSIPDARKYCSNIAFNFNFFHSKKPADF